jgi:stage IV sporulation protein FB
LITGLFREFIVLFSIIVVHEIGHLLAAIYFNFNIHKIYLYPFGGYIKFNDKLNRPLRDEFIILISGPLLQIVYFITIVIFNYFDLIRSSTFNIFINYHYSLLIFNLLPIFPLDGSKLVNIILSKFTSFKQSHLYMIYISYIALFIILFFTKFISFNVNIYLLLILILTKLINETKNHNDIYNHFLLERYLYNFHFKNLKVVIGNNLSKIMRDKRHLFIIRDKEITERELLKKRYDKTYQIK